MLYHLAFVVRFFAFREQLETRAYTKTANEQENIKFVTTGLFEMIVGVLRTCHTQ